jgi:hypothetical protein
MNFTFKHLANSIALGALVLAISACATDTLPVEKTYSIDIYQYNLSESSLALINANLSAEKQKNTGNSLSILLSSNKNYWKFIEAVGGKSFFATYKYTYLSCNIESSSLSTTQESGINPTQCQVNFQFGKSHQLMLQVANYKSPQATYTIQYSESIGAIQSYSSTYNTDKKYLILLAHEPESNVMIVINQNLLHKSWDYYKKTPQSDNK